MLDVIINIEINTGIYIGTEYNSFLAFYIPTIKAWISSDDMYFRVEFSHFSMKLGFLEFPEDIYDEPSSSNPKQSLESKLRMSNTLSEADFEFIDGIGEAMALSGGFYAVTAGIIGWSSISKTEKIIEAIQAAIFSVIVGIALFSKIVAINEGDNLKNYLLGSFFGYLISGLMVISFSFIGCATSKTLLKDLSKAWLIFLTLDSFFDYFGLGIDLSEILGINPEKWGIAAFSLLGGIIGLIFGCSAIMAVSAIGPGSFPGLILGIATIVFGIICLIAYITL